MRKEGISGKDIIKTVIVFLLLFCIICIPFYGVRDTGYHYKEVISKENEVALETENSIDTLFVGDSIAWAAYSPLQMYHEFGMTSYNLGTPGQWIGDSLSLITGILQYQHPQVIVLDASIMITPVDPLNYRLSRYLPVFHYHKYFLNLLTSQVEKDPEKGANLNLTVAPYTGSLDYMNRTTTLIPLDERNQSFLDQIKGLCDVNGIQLILTTAPTAALWTTGSSLGVQAWCDANQVLYVDYNTSEKIQEISFDWNTDTRDNGTHLNVNGSKKLCSSLGKLLQEKYSFVDHRKDTAYRSWETDYQNSKYYK